jgi:predicted heme/steroid binding protein
MKRTSAAILLLFLLATLAFAGCGAGSGSAEETASAEPSAEGTELVLTTEELAQYDGKNGNPAYIAVDGVIYDVTNVPQWKNGDHNGFTAGRDLTDEIKNISPHGVSKLKTVPVVGRLAD